MNSHLRDEPEPKCLRAFWTGMIEITAESLEDRKVELNQAHRSCSGWPALHGFIDWARNTGARNIAAGAEELADRDIRSADWTGDLPCGGASGLPAHRRWNRAEHLGDAARKRSECAGDPELRQSHSPVFRKGPPVGTSRSSEKQPHLGNTRRAHPDSAAVIRWSRRGRGFKKMKPLCFQTPCHFHKRLLEAALEWGPQHLLWIQKFPARGFCFRRS